MKTPVIAGQRVGAMRHPMTGSAKQSMPPLGNRMDCFVRFAPRNDGYTGLHGCGRECCGSGGGGPRGRGGSRQAPALRPAISQ